MSLKLYFDIPFSSATEVNQINPFVTTTGEDTYAVDDISTIGSTIQLSALLKRLFDGGFVKNGDNTITLDSVPAPGQQGVVSGLQSIISTTYDNTNVIPNGNIEEFPFYLGNIEDPNFYYYTPQPGASGIQVFFTNNITGIGPDLSWVQLASANAAGLALTYQATGTVLHTANMSSFSTVTASSAAGQNTIIVGNAQAGFQFWPGDYLHFNFAQSNGEILQLSSVTIAASTTLTLSGSFNFDHAVGEPVYFCARKFWCKRTTPIGYTANQATNYYNLSLDNTADKLLRP